MTFQTPKTPMSDSSDTNLQLKKRARRRLIGAFAFSGLAAVVLPMVMDEEPKQQVQDVQIRIPGQDQTPLSLKFKSTPVAFPDEKNADPEKPGAVAAADAEAKLADKAPLNPVEIKKEKIAEKAPEKSTEKPVGKTPAKLSEKLDEKPVARNASEVQRAAAILNGQSGDSPAAGGGAFVIVVGIFSNPANVKLLQVKIDELGIKVFTESLDRPDGKKTRVSAGPFSSRDVADKALEKMKRIGINGVISAKQ